MSGDEAFRLLEREKDSSPEARYRWRLECVRRGRPKDAGIERGDLWLTQWGDRFVVMELPKSSIETGKGKYEGDRGFRCLCASCQLYTQLLEPAKPQAMSAAK